MPAGAISGDLLEHHHQGRAARLPVRAHLVHHRGNDDGERDQAHVRACDLTTRPPYSLHRGQLLGGAGLVLRWNDGPLSAVPSRLTLADEFFRQRFDSLGEVSTDPTIRATSSDSMQVPHLVRLT